MKLYFLLYTSDEIWWKYINQIFKDLPLVGKAMVKVLPQLHAIYKWLQECYHKYM